MANESEPFALSGANSRRNLAVLRRALAGLDAATKGSVDFELYRTATIKNFEIALELSGKLLRKRLLDFVENPQSIKNLIYKDVLRKAAEHGLLANQEKWFLYRDLRNNTAHDYGEAFATEALPVIRDFIADAEKLLAQLDPHA